MTSICLFLILCPRKCLIPMYFKFIFTPLVHENRNIWQIVQYCYVYYLHKRHNHHTRKAGKFVIHISMSLSILVPQIVRFLLNICRLDRLNVQLGLHLLSKSYQNALKVIRSHQFCRPNRFSSDSCLLKSINVPARNFCTLFHVFAIDRKSSENIETKTTSVFTWTLNMNCYFNVREFLAVTKHTKVWRIFYKKKDTDIEYLLNWFAVLLVDSVIATIFNVYRSLGASILIPGILLWLYAAIDRHSIAC